MKKIKLKVGNEKFKIIPFDFNVIEYPITIKLKLKRPKKLRKCESATVKKNELSEYILIAQGFLFTK